MNSRRWKIAGMTAVIIAAFWPALRGEFLLFDDNLYVTDEPHVYTGLSAANLRWAWSAFATGNYHPLTWMSLQLDAQLFGINAAAFHAVNLLLHAANAALLFGLLLRMTGSAGRAMAVALIWAAHPLRLESVAWIAERKDVLSSFLGLLALHAHVGRRSGWTLVLMAMSLLAKPTLLTLPALLLLLDYWPLGRFESAIRNPKSAMVRLAPLMVLSLAGSLIALYAQRQTGSVIPMDQGLRLSNALVSLVRYPMMMIWPANLATPYSPPVWHAGWQIVGAGLMVAGITGLGWRYRSRYPAAWMGWLWYLIAVTPMIGVIKVGVQELADRYTYWPMMGLLIGVIHSLRLPVRIGAAATGAAALIFACLTWQGAAHWQNTQSLFGRAARLTKDNALAHWKYGDALGSAGQNAAAADQYRLTLLINPSLATPRRNLAVALAKQGQHEEAISQLQWMMQWFGNVAEHHLLLGKILLEVNRTAEAVQEFQEALRLEPGNAEAAQTLRMLQSFPQPPALRP